MECTFKCFIGENVGFFRLQICGLLISIYLKICFNVFGDVSEHQRPFSTHKPDESASPWPDLLEFAAGSDVSIVLKHEIKFVLGISNG